MSDHLPPRVWVALPGGERVQGVLLGWRKGAGGRWVPRVAIEAPPGTVTRVEPEPGPAPPAPIEPEWVLQPLPGDRVDLHTGACWMPDSAARVIGQAEARAMVADGRAYGGCTICDPQP